VQTLQCQPAQLDKLNRLLGEVWEYNAFYTQKWRQAGIPVRSLDSLDDLDRFPLTTRAELVADQHRQPPLGTNLTRPRESFHRIYTSSGTTGMRVFWADTAESWLATTHCSRALYLIAGVKPDDRLFLVLPFGSPGGPWIMYEGACRLGCACFPDAGSASESLHLLRHLRPTVLVAKPPQLLELAAAAKRIGIDPRSMGLNKIISPGAGLGTTRKRVEKLWAARCLDRYGMTEAGPVAAECGEPGEGMHLFEDDLIAEVIDPGTENRVPDGERGELVLTTLGRVGRPIIRYRTGDLVRLLRHHQCSCGRSGPMLVGGVSRG
jgi:phenylacetate-CoA ligase